MSVAVLGAGAFGTALAVALARDGDPVRLWARDAGQVRAMAETRENAERLPGVTLPDSVEPVSDLAHAAEAEGLLLSVPMQSLSDFLKATPDLWRGKRLVACCKGVDLATGLGPSGLIAAAAPDAVPALLSGPSFAVDIANGLPTALTLASADETAARAMQERLSTAVLRLYRSTDMAGVELGGALKNVIAIACGACIGEGLGDSARAALMTRGFAEMTRLAAKLGAKPETLAGLSGLGDLALTCTSELSRNYRFGLALGRGEVFDASLTVEGVKTAEAVRRLAERLEIDLPICAMVHEVGARDTSVAEAIRYLLNRPLKEE